VNKLQWGAPPAMQIDPEKSYTALLDYLLPTSFAWVALSSKLSSHLMKTGRE